MDSKMYASKQFRLIQVKSRKQQQSRLLKTTNESGQSLALAWEAEDVGLGHKYS